MCNNNYSAVDRYGEIGDVSCPKSKICTEKNNDGNSGYAFVRFADKRDMMLALGDLKGNKIVVHDNILGGEVIPPLHWPTEKTRRYY